MGVVDWYRAWLMAYFRLTMLLPLTLYRVVILMYGHQGRKRPITFKGQEKQVMKHFTVDEVDEDPEYSDQDDRLDLEANKPKQSVRSWIGLYNDAMTRTVKSMTPKSQDIVSKAVHAPKYSKDNIKSSNVKKEKSLGKPNTFSKGTDAVPNSDQSINKSDNDIDDLKKTNKPEKSVRSWIQHYNVSLNKTEAAELNLPKKSKHENLEKSVAIDKAEAELLMPSSKETKPDQVSLSESVSEELDVEGSTDQGNLAKIARVVAKMTDKPTTGDFVEEEVDKPDQAVKSLIQQYNTLAKSISGESKVKDKNIPQTVREIPLFKTQSCAENLPMKNKIHIIESEVHPAQKLENSKSYAEMLPMKKKVRANEKQLLRPEKSVANPRIYAESLPVKKKIRAIESNIQPTQKQARAETNMTKVRKKYTKFICDTTLSSFYTLTFSA